MKTRHIKKWLGLNLAAALLLAPLMNSAATIALTGAGATFPYPVYSKWFDEYAKIKDVKINYQSIGSGGGIRQITSKTVDFGATDGPMTDQHLSGVDGKILHIPTVLGAVVPTFNLRGVTDLKLTGPVIAEIFLGNIERWNDARIADLNPGAKLPNSRITVVHRSDGSGTTFTWVDYLCKVSPEWNEKVGRGTSVNWPTGLGGKGNEGVAGLVRATPNSIGYVELIYAVQNKISHAAVRNAEGEFIQASLQSVSAAAAGAALSMPADYRVSITNPPGKGAYPIATYTWLLIYETNPGNKGQVIKDFLEWAMGDGQKIAADLGYAPLPDNVNQMVRKTLTTIK